MYMGIVLFAVFVSLIEAQQADSSFDSLVASQCRARCLSLYPWAPESQEASPFQAYLAKRDLSRIMRQSIRPHNKNQRGHVKWNKVMESCSKNTNCLQCTLPCDIPTNLLANCKYLCKNRNRLCLDSCDLLAQLSETKYGACPAFNVEPQNSIQLFLAASSKQLEQPIQCSNYSKSISVAALVKHNDEEDKARSVVECGRDSDCGDIKKCCPLNPACPNQGNVCAKPAISTNQDLASIPFNLTIIERKKGKTVILNWDCAYNKNKPTLFVVEGRWSLKSPQTTVDADGRLTSSDTDSHMTKWGYLAQTVNNNWIILRNINRGRWYKFRVASITKSGTLGYSKPTALFILSAAPKPPSQPQNLTVSKVYLDNGQATVNAELTWLPSVRSDLPISNYKLTWHQIDESGIPNQGYDMIDAQQLTKYTLKGLLPKTVYSVELVAISKYEDKLLESSPQRIQLDTSSVISTASALFLRTSNHEDVYDEENDEDEEIENDHKPPQQQIFTRNSPVGEVTTADLSKKPTNTIRNLTIKEPYFRNGLVKAKLSWLYEQEVESSGESVMGSASIKSVMIEQPMFTITWFPNKCLKPFKADLVTLPQRLLPTPITATTINTNFEIYELKYNCDYVVNVRLASKPSLGLSSSLQPVVPPQVASAQFKVPQCNLVNYIGRIKPICYAEGGDSTAPNEISTPTSTASSSTVSILPTTINSIGELPRIYNIRHRIAEKHPDSDLYSVEFKWSLQTTGSSKTQFSGYQISVVPKAIPGFGSSTLILGEAEENNNGLLSFGSVGAIVDKDQRSFVVKQLRASVKYIFQIQVIALDNQSYGPLSNLEFKINGEKEVELGRKPQHPSIQFHQRKQKFFKDYEPPTEAYYDYENLASSTATDSIAPASSASQSRLDMLGLVVVVLLGLLKLQ